jgi:hypothetical protein
VSPTAFKNYEPRIIRLSVWAGFGSYGTPDGPMTHIPVGPLVPKNSPMIHSFPIGSFDAFSDGTIAIMRI